MEMVVLVVVGVGSVSVDDDANGGDDVDDDDEDDGWAGVAFEWRAELHHLLQQLDDCRVCSFSANLRPWPGCGPAPSFFGSFLAENVNILLYIIRYY